MLDIKLFRDEPEVIFESERINFIKLTEKLIDDYLNMINDVEVQKYISHERKTYTIDEEKEWIKNNLENNNLIFSMIEKETNEFIGNIEIIEIKNNIGLIGISITSKKQNNHYGQEAIKRLIDFALNNLKLDGLELNVYNFNERGRKCYENVGFVKVGSGKTYDDIHMVLKVDKK